MNLITAEQVNILAHFKTRCDEDWEYLEVIGSIIEKALVSENSIVLDKRISLEVSKMLQESGFIVLRGSSTIINW